MKNFHLLHEFLPAASHQTVRELLEKYPVHIRVTGKRKTKLGDFRPQPNSSFHIISINHDLNKYAFLITLLHEIAHLIVWNHFQQSVLPHGQEWKKTFGQLLHPFLSVFPEDLRRPLHSYMNNPSASSCSDRHLNRALKKYDPHSVGTFLEDLPAEAYFKIKLHKGMIFKKGSKARTRFKCLETQSKKEYWVNAQAEVLQVNEIGQPLTS